MKDEKNTDNGYRALTNDVLAEVSKRAAASPRKRMNHNFHELPDRVQRMLNAIEPGTYLRPHRHLDPPKTETFLLLRGEASAVIFEDQGTVRDIVRLSERTGNLGVDIKPGTWHSLISQAPGTVIFETKEGPYVPATDKDFAPWAPPEGSSEAAAYLQKLLRLAS